MMSKRFTETDKWNKIWFRSLSPVDKCFWMYLCDRCNHAGIWEVDFALAEFFIGTLDEVHIREAFQHQYVEIHNGKKWFIGDFIEFQYGKLNLDNRVHQSVHNILEKEGVLELLEGASKPLVWAMHGLKDKDKDKIKVKQDGYSKEFEVFWSIYPRKVGKRAAWKAWLKLKDINMEQLIDAVNIHSMSIQWTKDNGTYIPHPATWLNGHRWEDEIQPSAEVNWRDNV